MALLCLIRWVHDSILKSWSGLIDQESRYGTIGDSGNYMMSISNQKISRDDKRVAVAKVDPQAKTRDIYIIDIARNTSSRLTFDPAEDRVPDLVRSTAAE